MRLATLLMVGLLLGACAAAPRTMEYFPESPDGVPATMAWPGAAALPRIEYAGQLVGERNFRALQSERSAGERFLRWVIGLGNRRDREARLIRPQSGVVDGRGRILVTDAGRPGVFVFDEAAAEFSIWLDATVDQAFLSPVGIALLGGGEVAVADADLGEVFVLDADGKPLRRFGGEDLERPTGIAADATSGNVFVADTAAHCVKVFSADGRFLRTIGEPGDAPGQLNAPIHVGVRDGRLYVSDALNARVLIYSIADGALDGDIGARGIFVGNLVRPKGVAFDPDGNVYVVESYHDHLLIYDEDGQLLLPLGGAGSDIGRFFLPAGAWSQGDRIFVADMFNARVVIFRYVGSGA